MGNYDASIRVHTEMDNTEIKQTEAEIKRLTKQLDNVRQRSSKLEVLGGTEKQFASLGYDAEILEDKLAVATEHLEQLKAVQAPENLSVGFNKAEQSAKKCFKTVDDGARKGHKGMGSMMKVLKNMLISMVAFQVMFKGAAYIAEGFKNLVQYSSELNSVFSDMKSETATLKNSLATAFAPIALEIIPHLTKLVSWLNTAMDAMTQFWAVLGGKSTYTKAKKQVIDYANSLKDASKTAKGALAAFDEINVLHKDEGTSAGDGGELTGADAFEEAEVDVNKFAWVEWLRDNLSTIMDIVGMIGIGLLAWKLASAFTNDLTTLLGIAMAAGGAFIFVKNAIDAWNNGIDWDNLSGMLAGATLLIAGLGIAFGTVGAAIGAVIAGVGLLIVGIHDIMENGVNLKNAIAVIAGTFLTVSAIAGAAVGAIAAVIAGLVLAVIADWENFKETVWEPMKLLGDVLLGNIGQIISGAKKMLDGFEEFFKGVFTGNFKLALQGIKKIIDGVVMDGIVGTIKLAINTIIGMINTAQNLIVGVINSIIAAINNISFTVPDWVPGIGGKTFGGFNIPTLPTDNIPYLETGGTVISATLANLGEKNKREVVLPLEDDTGWADTLAEKTTSKMKGGRPTVVILEVDGKEVARTLAPYIDDEDARIGTQLKTT